MKMKRTSKIAFVLLLLAAAWAVCGCVSFDDTPAGVVINEVVSSNGGSLFDDALGTPDWIELYNPESSAVSLAGWSLVDGSGEQNKFTFPEGCEIAPRGYLVVLCADGLQAEGLAASFGLSKTGEELSLRGADGKLIDRLTIPALEKDISYAKGGGGFGFSYKPTPGAGNEGIVGTLAEALEKLGGDEEEFVYEDGALVITELHLS